MRIYFALQGTQDMIFRSLEVSESITAIEALELPSIKALLTRPIDELKLGVNSIELDGKYKPLPQHYRMSDGERLEVYRPLNQDPKERRKIKAGQK